MIKAFKRLEKESFRGEIRADSRARLPGFKSQLHAYFIFSVPQFPHCRKRTTN